VTLSPTITLRAEVADAVSEAVAAPPTPAARAAAIAYLIGEMYEAVQWRVGAEGSGDELASLGQVVAAVQAHVDRMGESH